jgi:hypothetical protein
MSSVSGMIEQMCGAGHLRRVGEHFVAALAARDFARLTELITDDVQFRLLVPRGPQANTGAAETLSRFIGWYGGVEELLVESSYIETVAERLVIAYRLRLRDADGWRLIEQHLVAYAGPDGRLTAIDLLCTGFHVVRGDVTGTGDCQPSVVPRTVTRCCSNGGFARASTTDRSH